MEFPLKRIRAFRLRRSKVVATRRRSGFVPPIWILIVVDELRDHP